MQPAAQRRGPVAASLTRAKNQLSRGLFSVLERCAITMAHETLAGVFTPVLTPFDKTLTPDATLFVKFCSWILTQGAGLAVFGTNSEANSLTVEEKLELL